MNAKGIMRRRNMFLGVEFNNKTSISTSVASGMGLLLAQNFSALGGNVVLCDVNEQVLNEQGTEIHAKGQGKAIGVVCYVRDF